MKIVYDDGHSIDVDEMATLILFEPDQENGVEVSAVMPNLDEKAEAPPQVVAIGAVLSHIMKPGVLNRLIDEMEGEIEQDRAVHRMRN